MFTSSLSKSVFLCGTFAICSVTSAQAFRAQQAGSPVIDLDPYVIVSERDTLQPGTLPLGPATESPLGHPSVSGQLADVPGVSLASRGAFAEEPVIRGLGFDRVVTDLNGLKLPNASPTRTHSPINRIHPSGFQSVSVSRFLTSLSAGPPASGGRISLQSLPAEYAADDPANKLEAQLGLSWFPDRDGHLLDAGLDLQTRGASIRANIHQADLGNYESGNGLEVPSRHEAWGSTLSATISPAGSSWRHSLDAVYHRQNFTENAALPLDTDDSEFVAFTSVHTLREGSSVDRLRLRFGYTEADATLSNRSRPTAPLPVIAETFVRAAHADFERNIPLGESGKLAYGMDANLEERDAIRRRGPTAVDAIWPDVEYRQLGLFVQSHMQPKPDLIVRTEARLDYSKSRAGIDDKTAFGTPLPVLFSRYNGSGSDNDRREDTVLSANLMLSQQLTPKLRLYAGAGSSTQIPPPTERYRSFLNALGGGFELGNPGLEPEIKRELAFGAIMRSEHLDLQADLYFFQIKDFIWRQRIGTTEGVLPMNPAPPVLGYRNVDAAFHGLELHGTVRINKQFSLPFSLAWNEGELREAGPGYVKGDPLPEIPPPELRIGAVYQFELSSTDVFCRWTVRHTGKGDNELPALNPLYTDTDAHTRHDLSLTLVHQKGITLEISVRNVFDETAYPYLSPPVASIRPASGDLSPGDRVPAPGREFICSLRATF